MLRALREAASKLLVRFLYETTAIDLHTDPSGRVAGIIVADADGRRVLDADAVVIASGGFEGNAEMLERELGPGGADLVPIAPGGLVNQGEGIEMALRLGASRGGEWNNFHAEPVDPRSGQAEALVMVFPYGILVNRDGRRFTDEGRGTVDEIYEDVARQIWHLPDRIAYFITDQHIKSIPEVGRGILTGAPPIIAETVDELATLLELDSPSLAATIQAYNSAAQNGAFDWRSPDGKSTDGILPVKSNWAVPLERPPFISYPISCAIVFTFGGLKTDSQARVLSEAGGPICNLYAAGECTGIYYGKYPGGTSVMRGLIYGKIAGREAGQAPEVAEIIRRGGGDSDYSNG